MKKLLDRLLIFLIGLPAVIFVVVALPQKHHLAVNIITIILSALGALELAGLLKQKNNLINPIEAIILGAIHPLAMTLVVSFDCTDQLVPIVFVIGASWLLVSRIFVSEEKLKDTTNYIAAGFAVMIYPGLFMAWLIKMTLWPHAEQVILIFLLMVIANDSVAWAAGMLFGKGNRGIITASPNKSIAGFIGGIGASTLIGLGAIFYIPDVFSSKWFISPLAGIILGFLSGIAACLGDLGESAMKRSANIKDSGTIIPGRGGILDSIDSISLAAPVFYVSYWFLFDL